MCISRSAGLAAAMLSCAAAVAGAEVIGPYNIQAAPVSAVQVGGGGDYWRWLNVDNVPLTINAAFSGPGIIDSGFANGRIGTSVEVTFGAGALYNAPGDDLVFFDSRFSINSYNIFIDFDGFESPFFAGGLSFSHTGVVREYYYGGGGPHVAEVMAIPLDLSFWGVPANSGVTRVRFVATSNDIDPLGFGSLVPAPGAAGLLACGGLAASRRRRR